MSTEAISRGTDGAHRANFIAERLGSALAVLPLGVWTLNHLWNNLAAFQGGPAWQSAVTEYPHPFAEAVMDLNRVSHSAASAGRSNKPCASPGWLVTTTSR